MRPIPTFCAAVAAVVLWTGLLHAQPVGTPKGRVGYYAFESGNFDGPIWRKFEPGKDFPKKIDRNARPNSMEEDACIGTNDVTVTINKPQIANSWQHRGANNRTLIKEGADFKVNGFTIQRGNNTYRGTISMTGGSLEVKDLFFLCGGNVTEDANCVFDQSGGTVTLVNLALNVTSPFPLTASPTAVGVYNFSGGTINLLSESTAPNRVGIRKGYGKGTFNWTGGVLNAKALSEGITNNGGILSLGGEGVIGETKLISDTAQTYVQAAKGVLSVDLGGRSKFDRLIWKDKTNHSAVKLESGAVIRINCLRGYKPTAGVSFEIISTNRLEGGDRLILEGDAAKDFSYTVTESGPKAGLTLVCTPGKGGRRMDAEQK